MHDVVYSSETRLKKCAFCNVHFSALKLICINCKGEDFCSFVLDNYLSRYNKWKFLPVILNI